MKINITNYDELNQWLENHFHSRLQKDPTNDNYVFRVRLSNNIVFTSQMLFGLKDWDLVAHMMTNELEDTLVEMKNQINKKLDYLQSIK